MAQGGYSLAHCSGNLLLRCYCAQCERCLGAILGLGAVLVPMALFAAVPACRRVVLGLLSALLVVAGGLGVIGKRLALLAETPLASRLPCNERLDSRLLAVEGLLPLAEGHLEVLQSLLVLERLRIRFSLPADELRECSAASLLLDCKLCVLEGIDPRTLVDAQGPLERLELE